MFDPFHLVGLMIWGICLRFVAAIIEKFIGSDAEIASLRSQRLGSVISVCG